MRARRSLAAGAEYHVIARANRQEFLLETEEIKDMMLLILLEAKRKYRFEMRNFCIMSNHIHLLIRPTNGENLSKIMQWVLSVFAIRFNKRFKIHGHVWYDRFKSYIISTLRQLLHTFQYIMDNPVRAGIVESPWSYRFGGIWHIQSRSYDLVEPPDLLLDLCLPLVTSKAKILLF
ncbi:MAG: hypothetical protein HN368_09355 [Spirochaetales bacterium]|jgi:putative transposase|nr:hypothetical protein [Spirochaetales bacterium]